MTTPRLRDNPDYVRLLRRYAVLLEMAANRLPLPLAEREELQQVSAEMTEIELMHRRGIRDAVDDYDLAIGLAGDLSGAEL